MLSSESSPSSVAKRHGHADARERRHRGEHARQVGGAAGSGDDDDAQPGREYRGA